MPKLRGQQIGLFQVNSGEGEWRPPATLPDLSSFKRLWTDCETNTNDKFKARVCGMAVVTEGAKKVVHPGGRVEYEGAWYFPKAHLAGGNMDADVFAWANSRQGLLGKHISNINTGFDAEALANEGVDLEGSGCTLRDISHSAALIDENRFKGPNLNELMAEFLGPDRKKLDTNIAPEDIHKVHSSLIGPYAIEDAIGAKDVDLAQEPYIERDRLERVLKLESDLIWPNNHMERSGMRLDLPKLAGWQQDLAFEHQTLAMKVWQETGVKLKPNSPASWHELFCKLGLEKPAYVKQREAKDKSRGTLFMKDVPNGYTDAFLKKFDHAMVRAGLRMRRMESLDSKYLGKYDRARLGDKLPFHLYQLRASEDDYGTVVGRYSSANVNIQQVFKVSNQVDKFCDCGAKKDSPHGPTCFGLRFIVRELMIADEGFDMFAVDGSQLQFRLFAHYSRDQQLIRAYNDNPDVDFHQMVAELFVLSRQAAKHNNFAMVLGMGREKLADRLGMSCECRDRSYWSRLLRRGMAREEAYRHIFGVNSNHDSGCPARESNDLAERYDAEFPAAKKTMEAVSDAAESRGVVKTLLGRRRRFKDSDGNVINSKFYSGFAALLQGGEADMVKSKILTIYNNRKAIGVHKMRAPVHDEATGDIDKDPAMKRRFTECCNDTVEIPLKVPMIWEPKFGANWGRMKKLPKGA